MKARSPHPDKPIFYTTGGREQLLKLLGRYRIELDIAGLAEISSLPSDEDRRLDRRRELLERIQQASEDTSPLS